MNVSKIAGWAPMPSGTQAKYDVSTAVVPASTILTIPQNCLNVLISFKGADCRVTFDGTTPDSTTGHVFYDGDREVWSKQAFSTAKFIRNAGTDCQVTVTPGIAT